MACCIPSGRNGRPLSPHSQFRQITGAIAIRIEKRNYKCYITVVCVSLWCHSKACIARQCATRRRMKITIHHTRMQVHEPPTRCRHSRNDPEELPPDVPIHFVATTPQAYACDPRFPRGTVARAQRQCASAHPRAHEDRRTSTSTRARASRPPRRRTPLPPRRASRASALSRVPTLGRTLGHAAQC